MKYPLFVFLLITGNIFYLQGQTAENSLNKVLDFTVLQNGNMSVMYDGNYDVSTKNITGILQSYDYKGRLLYDRQYQFNIPDSILQESNQTPEITEAYVVSASKNHSLFYGRINSDNRLTFVIVLDKRGRFKKQLLLAADFTKIEADIDSKSYRAKAFFWLFSNQNYLRISPYLTATKTLYSQVYIRNIVPEQKEIMFDAICLTKANNHTVIQYKDDLQVKWEHQIKGNFSDKQVLFKLTETAQSFYFILYENHEEMDVPVIYVIEKSTGKISVQTIPTVLKA